MYACMHTYIVYIRTYVRTYVRTYIHTYIHTVNEIYSQRDLKSTGLRASEETVRTMWRRKVISHTGDPTVQEDRSSSSNTSNTPVLYPPLHLQHDHDRLPQPYGETVPYACLGSLATISKSVPCHQNCASLLLSLGQ